MGVMAAFIFAAQMLNFPVAGGTSGHFLGGALAAIVLGPWAGILVMTAVIAVQGVLVTLALLILALDRFRPPLLPVDVQRRHTGASFCYRIPARTPSWSGLACIAV